MQIETDTLEGKSASATKPKNTTSLPKFDVNMNVEDMEKMVRNSIEASNFLKALGHEGRLMILCHLATGEKSVTELEDLLSARQSAVSQQLTRLRFEGLVSPRREGTAIYYTLSDDRARQILELVYDLFCNSD
jgi:DNA-binding transcriptional ArsR family regulator